MPTKPTLARTAPAARAPRKTTKAAPPKPADVTLDLDSLEREGAPEPFTFLHDGHQYQMLDPSDVDWQDLLTWDNNPYLIISKGLVADREMFFASKCPAWKMQALQRAYLKHFGLPDPLAAGDSPA